MLIFCGRVRNIIGMRNLKNAALPVGLIIASLAGCVTVKETANYMDCVHIASVSLKYQSPSMAKQDALSEVESMCSDIFSAYVSDVRKKAESKRNWKIYDYVVDDFKSELKEESKEYVYNVFEN